MSAPTIRAEGLHKTYVMGRHLVRALDGVDLMIPPEAFVGVIGPSGSGKSTLLHLLGGLDRASGGSIAVDGQVLEQLDEHALAMYRLHRVGFIFQSFNLIASMSALENVAFPLVFRRVARRERWTIARDLLTQVGLATHADHRPGELSGGQQQRVAVARALANSPDVILADEPTGNLDTQSGAVIMDLLAQLHGQGKTVLVVSHDPRITRYATMTIRLLDGRVVDKETYEAALEEPAAPTRRAKRKS
ncbi:MAG: macrolide ABC transporter ATP-binding protein [Gammaproteobacteria bacterium RBG_16_66_13]|jgi:putative ABC transport system ATP-binding protein|nr:MAG: macrolide ABC transporter ATP-binding protein [Gammaproteobacteria bacterium RBG_16_66_13]